MLSPIATTKEVAKLLEKGYMCYVERRTREIFPIELDKIKDPENQAQIKLIEKKIANYIKVEAMPTHILIFAMQAFLDEVTDQEIRKELSNSLKRKKPTRNFLQIVRSRLDIDQHWKLYIMEEYIEYVGLAFIKDYNY